MASIAATAGIAVGTALVAVGSYAINLADEMDQAVNGVIAATGASIDEAERYQAVIEGIYTNNYGDGFDDIAQAVTNVELALGTLDDTELQNIVEKGYLMQDTFGIDMEESLRGVDAMMSQFGITSMEAYELMAQGAQDGLNQNGDLADQMAEYAVYYADLGFTAEEMFNMMASGMESGAYQLDYLNDAMKEFGIRAIDGSDTSAAAFEALGLDAEEMTAAFAQGGEASTEAFALVTEALKACDDQVLQNEIGVGLFGTKFEDLGADAVLALTQTEGAIDSTLDTLSAIEDIKYDSMSEMFTGMTRSVEALLLPLGEQLIPILTEIIDEILPVVEELLPPLMDLVAEFIPMLSEIISTILPPLIDLVLLVTESIMPILEQVLPVLITLLETLLPPIVEILNVLLPPLIDILNILLEPLLELINVLLPPLISLFEALEPCIEALMPILTALASIIADTLGNTIEAIMPYIQGLIDLLIDVIDFITNVFQGNWQGAWEGIVSIFKGIVNLIPTYFESVLNAVISAVNGLISGINKLTGTIGITAIPTISSISLPRFSMGIDYVPSDDMPALLHRGEAVLTATEADLYRSLGGKGALEQMLSSSVPDSTSTLPTSEHTAGNQEILQKLTVIISMLEALANLSVYLNTEKVGKLVAPTVNKTLGTTETIEQRGKF